MKKKDVLVVGGGAAGLSAALTLSRARRSVVVIDGGDPRNAPAAAAHGLLGHEGINPLELLSRGCAEVEYLSGEIISAHVTGASAGPDEVRLTLDGGRNLVARVLVIATGVRDELPAIPGLRERWGRDVVHCPYCHGWEIRDRRIGLVSTGPMSVMQALLFHQWSDRVRLFTQDIRFSEEELGKLDAVGIPVTHGGIARVETKDDRLTGVRLGAGSLVELDALAVPSPTHARVDGLEGLGLEIEETPMGTAITADPAGRTPVPGGVGGR